MKFVIAFISAALLLLIIWSLRGVLLLPVKHGRTTDITTLISVNGSDDRLEHTLDGLIWLRENGTLKSEIIITLNDCDENTVEIAERYAKTQDKIKIIKNGDIKCPSLRR